MEYKAIEATNTKTRRLAYVQALVTILKTGNFSEAQLRERIVRWSNENVDSLRGYWVPTGEITSTRQNSAGSRYIDLAVSLGLIASISGVYRYTRVGIVLLTLLERTQAYSVNTFQLALCSRLFFAYLLLQKDADFFLLVSEFLLMQERPSLAQMQREFKDRLIERLNLKIAMSPDERTRRAMIDRRREVDNWKKPERYAEHLIPPRLNWMLDLLFLDTTKFPQHVYSLTRTGASFLKSVPTLNAFVRDIDSNWIDNDFWRTTPILTENTNSRIWFELELKEQLELVDNLLRIAYKSFRITNVPRISLYQTQIFICISLAEMGVVITPREFSDWLNMNQFVGNVRYEVRQSPRENESYIVVRIG